MNVLDGVDAVEIGEGAGDAQHAMIAAGGKPHPLHGFGKQTATAFVRRRRLVVGRTIGSLCVSLGAGGVSVFGMTASLRRRLS